MKTILSIFIALMFFQSCSIIKNKTITDERTERKELVGTCTRAGFQKEEFKMWFDKGYNEYQPKEEIVNKLKAVTLYKGVTIKIIFGTWCGDSRREVPRFFKLVDKADIPEKIIRLTAVDTKKTSRDKSIEGIAFTHIPTFIFYRKGSEIGRIVESTEKSLEEDMLKILTKLVIRY